LISDRTGRHNNFNKFPVKFIMAAVAMLNFCKSHITEITQIIMSNPILPEGLNTYATFEHQNGGVSHFVNPTDG